MDAGHLKHELPQAPADVPEVEPQWDNGIQIESCPALEQIVVRTRNSVYDIVVVSGREGDVMIRGGRLFPEFRCARLVGATAGGHTVKVLGVYVGLSVELFVDRHYVTTSPVLEISRSPAGRQTASQCNH
jgi:hypothetical protein